MQIRIPRTAARNSPRTYALLILRKSRSKALRVFDGRLFQPGQRIDESELWPTPHYPRTPLLVEYAGPTGFDARGRRARGHNRSRDLYILWRFDAARREWQEIARAIADGPEWFEYFRPIVEREIIPPDIDHVAEARAAIGTLAALIDGTLNQLANEGRSRALSFLYDEVAARFAESIEENAHALRPIAAASERGKRRRAA